MERDEVEKRKELEQLEDRVRAIIQALGLPWAEVTTQPTGWWATQNAPRDGIEVFWIAWHAARPPTMGWPPDPEERPRVMVALADAGYAPTIIHGQSGWDAIFIARPAKGTVFHAP